MSTQNKKTARRLSLLEQENAQLRSDLEATRLGLRREVDRIAQLRGEESWRDIATAPKDQDASIFGGWANLDVNIIRWNSWLKRWCWPGSSPDQPQPTHWMPLPLPPVPAVTKESL